MAKAGRSSGGKHLQGDKITGGHSSLTDSAYLVAKAAIAHPLVSTVCPGPIAGGDGAKKPKLCFVANQIGGRGWQIKVLGRTSVQILRITLIATNQNKPESARQEEADFQKYLEAALEEDKKTLRRLLQQVRI